MSHWCHTPSIPFERMLFFLFKLWYNAAKNNQKIHMWKRFLKEHNVFSHSKIGTGLSAKCWEKQCNWNNKNVENCVKNPKKRFFLAMELNNSILLRYTAATVLKRSFNTLK